MSGILEQLNSTEPIHFKRLDTNMIMEALKTIVNNKRKSTINLFMGEL